MRGELLAPTFDQDFFRARFAAFVFEAGEPAAY